MTSPLKNVWHHRRVAESAAKSCWVCYKPSNSVLITPDQKDFFYICVGHLKDRHFAIPDADEAAAIKAKQEKEALDREIEKVKKEYEEKQRKKKEKKKEDKKAKDKDKGKEKEKDKEEKDDAEKDEKEKDEKIKALEETQAKIEEEQPRIYSLHKNFYQMRLDRIRNAEIAKRNRERLKDPSAFPSVPTGDPS